VVQEGFQESETTLHGAVRWSPATIHGFKPIEYTTPELNLSLNYGLVNNINVSV
jgi:hypothetical protein